MKSKNGLTLVEILVVTAVLSAMIIATIMAIDPIGAMAKARDAQRKKDLNRIKVAFEDYMNDRSCYPSQSIVDSLSSAANCKTGIFSPWMTSWPCDPNGSPYPLVVGDDANCPKWYKIMTYLENKNDLQISDQGGIGLGVGVSVNYGVASGNVSNSQ